MGSPAAGAGSVAGTRAQYAGSGAVYVASGDSASAALRDALSGADLDGLLERELADRTARISIKPNIMGAARAAREATYTDPQLVEQLIAHLRERGHDDITLVESGLERGPSVSDVAERLGYTLAGYRLVDLSADTIEFDYGGVLGIQPAGRAWIEADLRISFAKNKGDWRYFWSGAMANVFGCLPLRDKARAYAGRGHEPEECVRTLLDAAPVHFGLIDAWRSRDGSGWSGDGEVRDTGEILASNNVFALDWVAGEKMDIDPALNPMMQEALHRWGRVEIDRQGQLMPWQPWRSPALAIVVAASMLERRGGATWTIQ